MFTSPLLWTKAFVYEQTIPYKDFNGSRNQNFLNETVRFFLETTRSSASLTAQQIRNPVNLNCTVHLVLRHAKCVYWSTVLLETLTGYQLAKKLPALYGTRNFVTAFTRAHHLSIP